MTRPILSCRLACLAGALLFLAAPRPAAAEGAPAAALRVLLPSNTLFSVKFEGQLKALTEEYNRLHPGSPVEILHHGDEFSSLKELIAGALAGVPPDIAAIESAELPAIENMKLARLVTVPPEPFKRLLKGMSPEILRQAAARADGRQIALPFTRTLPMLIVDQEALFRAHINTEKLPKTWSAFVDLVRKLAQEAPDRHALSLPLLGPRGLWLFEALAGRPLWNRETGGLRSNRELIGAVRALQSLVDDPRLGKNDDTWDRALQTFLDRRSPILVTSLDMLPYISAQATFRWAAAPMPRHSGGLADMATGTDLVVLRDQPNVWDFLNFLYSPSVAARWTVAGAFLPLRPDWKKAAAGLPGQRPLEEWGLPKTARSTDLEVIRARSSWIQALHHLFGDSARRLAIDSVFLQLDGQVNSGANGL